MENFVETFVEYTDGLPSSVLWRKWAAIGTIAGVLERKVWSYTLQSNHYPNQYIFLIGPPASGKTVLTSIVQELWYSLGDIHVAPSSASAASFIDALRAAEKRVIRPTEFVIPVQYNALSAAVNELGVLFRKNDGDFMAVVTDLYDGKRFGERKRTSKIDYTIEAPCVNIIGCGTPSFLGEFLPEGAWEQGFMSRVTVIYSGIALRPPLFSQKARDQALYKKLKEQLKVINSIYGEMEFQPETIEAISRWYDAGGPPVPLHPKLEHYNTRRASKILKLSMIASVNERKDRVVTVEHFQTALGWLLEAEALMPEVFKAISYGGHEQIIKDLWFFCFDKYSKNKKPVPKALVYEFLQRRLPAIQIEPMMRQLLNSKSFIEMHNDDGTLGWKPLARAED